MKDSLLLIGASTRSLLRWARQHVYAWLILAPVVLGITCFTLLRLAENLPAWQVSPELALIITTLVTLSLVGLSLSRASAEIYHPRRPESYFDALPVSSASHLHAALATRIARTLVVAGAALIARASFSDGRLLERRDLPAILCFTLLLAVSETVGALNWIHWGHKRNAAAALAALLLLVVNGSVSGLLLGILFRAARFSGRFEFWLYGICIAWIPIVYAVSYVLNNRWRRSDLEYARRLEAATRSTLGLDRVLTRRLPPVVAAQFARDVRLTIRAFSSAVHVVFAIGALCGLALLAALTTGLLTPVSIPTAWLDTTWLPQVIAIKVACVLAVVSLASLLPVLIAYELPHMWLERAAGTTGFDLLAAKIWYARFLTALAPVAIWIVGALTGLVPGSYLLPLLAECLWLWWLVSSLMGVLSFEMPTRADLAIIVTGTLGLALGLISAIFWPVGLIVYPQAMHSLTARGSARARYYMITEAE